MALQPGSRLASYEILSPLGSGGMGEVFRARDHKLGRDVAIKVLREEYAADRERLTRFEQEARAASALNHPHIVTIYDIGEAEGTRYLAMELIEGRMLRELIQAGPVSPAVLMDVAVQSAEGLAKAHEAGIVHRDLKPENIMLTRDGFVKILDFGLAKLIPHSLEELSEQGTLAGAPTRAGVLLGTVEYMSPEQAAGRPVDHRTDQFTLGVVLYEMATGRRPFERPTAAQTLAAIIEAEPEPLGRRSPDVPDGLAAIVARCLTKDAAGRYASTRELGSALRIVKEHPGAAAPGPEAALALPVGDYYVQKEGKVSRLSERKLRRRLRHSQFSGLEMVRRDGEERWRPLHALPVFRDEVAVGGDPATAARWRHVQGFGGHLASFVALGVFLTGQTGQFPWWMAFWGIGLVSHAFQVLPAVVGLIRDGQVPALSGRARSRPAIGAAPSPPGPISQSFVEEVDRVRGLLEKQGKGKHRGLLKEIDQLVESVSALAAKQSDLEEQTSPRELQRLEAAEREARQRLEGAEAAVDRKLYERQLELLGHRRRAIEKALLVLDRMRVRRGMAEQQLKQLRLDLSQAEARRMDAPELSSRILDIRYEVDALDQIDEELARR
jgi:hypothetical protein